MPLPPSCAMKRAGVFAALWHCAVVAIGAAVVPVAVAVAVVYVLRSLLLCREEGIVFDTSATDAMKAVMTFPGECYVCQTAGETRMLVTDVPHFKEVIIMSFLCEECGFKNVEVKGGGAVPDHGTVTKLSVTPGEHHVIDMRRDVIKSDTAMLEIPELELELSHGTLGGVYTTVSGAPSFRCVAVMLCRDDCVMLRRCGAAVLSPANE